MIDLDLEQCAAVNSNGDVMVTACPGSGKTRVLTARLIRGVKELQGGGRERVAALTFTNRAADEIRARLDQQGVQKECIWAGTIHALALEWVLRPYAPYSETVRYGFSVADDFFCDRALRDIRTKLGLAPYVEINTAYNRDGVIKNTCVRTDRALALYMEELRLAKLIDYDEVLYLAYRLLADNPEIAANLGAIFRLFCVDEVQDIQDLQYGILSEIYRASRVCPIMFFVGDPDQSIYESLGALTKSPEEIVNEFGMDNIQQSELIGNYRSTQRIIDYCKLIRNQVAPIASQVDQPEEHGIISFENQTIHRDDLSTRIASLVQSSLNSGVPENEICIVAPQWAHVRVLARQLVDSLPGVNFDAPGLSPLHSTRDSLWFKLARLFLTDPVPQQIRSRARWANELIVDFEFLLGSEAPTPISSVRRLLRLVNQISSSETEGIPYLRDVFAQFLECSIISLDNHETLSESFEHFFEKAESRLADFSGGMVASVEGFRKIFSFPSGVVVNTCHGVKGEEYDTVIGFGMLRGYVPHWSVVIHGSASEAYQRESKLLYVVASRAKRRLHLIAETGRQTQSGNSYQTSALLEDIDFDYD